jgi:hypothetical protein
VAAKGNAMKYDPQISRELEDLSLHAHKQATEAMMRSANLFKTPDQRITLILNATIWQMAFALALSDQAWPGTAEEMLETMVEGARKRFPSIKESVEELKKQAGIK